MEKPLLEFIQDTNAKKYKQFREFKRELRELMEQKNSSNRWESPIYNIDRQGKKKGPYSSRLNTELIIDIGDTAFKGYPFRTHTRKLKKMQVFPYKKTGLILTIEYENRVKNRPITESDNILDDDEIPPVKIRPTEKYEKKFLPECASGFIRDWKRDGICVERIKEEYK